MSDSSNSAMTAIVVIIAIVALLAVAYFAINMMNGQADNGGTINVELPGGNNDAQ